ncbi:Vacuolar-processing enzyme-like protein [Drosera capensis]
MASVNVVLVILHGLLALSSLVVDARGVPSVTKNVQGGTKWAVLVAGSKGYENYRHQADICHAYQVLKRGGLKDENIIVMMYDDIAHNANNPTPGVIMNKPNGPNVYTGVPKDYTGEQVTAKNLLAVILGDKAAVTGGSGKVVNSGPNDSIFIYYADHGAPGSLAMPSGDELFAPDLIATLKKKHASGTYKSMVIYVEACEAGSMFDGLLPTGLNIYVTTASNPDESSWATYYDDHYQTYLGDLYSVSWLENSDEHNLQAETLEQQYKVVKVRTFDQYIGSHVMQYGDTSISVEPVAVYMGVNQNTLKAIPTTIHESDHQSSATPVLQRDADVLYLMEKFRRAKEGSEQRAEARKKLNEELSHRTHIDNTVKAIVVHLLGEEKAVEVLNVVRPAGTPIVDDWNCLKTSVATYKAHCGNLSSYGMKYIRAFANMCNTGVHEEQMAVAVAQVCS